MLKKLLLIAFVLVGCAAQAQIPTRWLTNGNFDDFVIGGVYTAGATLGAGNCGAPWPTSNGFVATTNNNSNPNVTVPGWRSTDGNQINAGLGISTTGGAFNNCGTIGIASGWTEIFTTAVGNGNAQSGNYFNHNNPNNRARTLQNMCILPNDTPYYGISVRGRNDVNERIAIGIWSAANVGTIVNSTAGAVAGNSVGGGNVWGVDLSVGQYHHLV